LTQQVSEQENTSVVPRSSTECSHVRARFIPSETTTNRTYESRMFSVVWCTGGTTSPSSPPFPLAGRGRAKRRKDAGYCHLCHCHCQTLNAVAVQKTGAYAGITWRTSSAQAILFMRPEYGPSTGRAAAFCTQAGRSILLQGCNASWVRSGRQFNKRALALIPCLRRCFSRLEWWGPGPLGPYSCGF
jgi:hypothetical protein